MIPVNAHQDIREKGNIFRLLVPGLGKALEIRKALAGGTGKLGIILAALPRISLMRIHRVMGTNRRDFIKFWMHPWQMIGLAKVFYGQFPISLNAHLKQASLSAKIIGLIKFRPAFKNVRMRGFKCRGTA